jgi:CRISPR system Cascade subunit CasE
MADVKPLYRLSMEPDLRLLNAFGRNRQLRAIPPGGDLGYVLHAALTALFGKAAPQPFRLYNSPHRNRTLTLLAYTSHHAEALRDYAALQESQVDLYAEAAATLNIKSLVVKPMPTQWSAGRVYRFETRVRPVIRTTRNDPVRPGGGREIDAYVAALDKAADGDRPEREAVYAQWLCSALKHSGGALTRPEQLIIRSVKSTPLYTGDNRGHGPNGSYASVNGPDVLCEGLLTVQDPMAFAALMARGVGRHRAFGFGMLLLAPAG